MRVFEFIFIPGILGASFYLFTFGMIPRAYVYFKEGTSLATSFVRGFGDTLKPFANFLTTGNMELATVAGPGMGFVLGAFFYVLYKGENV